MPHRAQPSTPPLAPPPSKGAVSTHFSRREDPGGESLPLNIRFFGYSFWQFQEAFDWPPHEHVDYELIIPHRGTYRCLLNREACALEEGELLIVKPGDRHEDHLERDIAYIGINFRIVDVVNEVAAIPLFAEGIPVSAQCSPIDPTATVQFARAMREAEALGGISAVQVQDALMSAFFWRLLPQLPADALSRRFRAVLGVQDFSIRLERLFARSLYQPLPLAQMAREMGMSVRSLSERCHRTAGASPARLFREFKLRHAASLLRTTKRPIKEISYSLGFANPYHFSRAFKQCLGTAPSCYRRPRQPSA